MQQSVFHDLIIYFKSLIVLSLVWLTDFFVINIAALPIISPDIREFLIDIKEAVAILTSILVFILTAYKIRNERKK